MNYCKFLLDFKHSFHPHWTWMRTSHPHPAAPGPGTGSPSAPRCPPEEAPWPPGWGWGPPRIYCQIRSPWPLPEHKKNIYEPFNFITTHLVAILIHLRQLHFLQNLFSISNTCSNESLQIILLDILQKLIGFVRELHREGLLLRLRSLGTFLIIRNAISIKIIIIEFELW